MIKVIENGHEINQECSENHSDSQLLLGSVDEAQNNSSGEFLNEFTEDSSSGDLKNQIDEVPFSTTESTIADTVIPVNTTEQTGIDLYDSYILGHEGVVHKQQSNRKGFKQEDIKHFSKLVLKPDGHYFSEKYCRVGAGSTKGDQTERRVNLLQHCLKWFPKAEIRRSGGTEASFHVILSVDESVSELRSTDPDSFGQVLRGLRLIAFCDRIGDSDILSALSARSIGSINPKTQHKVELIHTGDGSYSLSELQSLTASFEENPELSLFCSWFGVQPNTKCRCPFHDSKDPDLQIGSLDKKGKLACWGADHCAGEKSPAVFDLFKGTEHKKSLIDLLLADEPYKEKWKTAFRKFNKAADESRREQARRELSERLKKKVILITPNTPDDDIVKQVADSLAADGSVYRDVDGAFITLQEDPVEHRVLVQRHDTLDKFIALVSRYTAVEKESKNGVSQGSLPYDRARVAFYRPDTLARLPVLKKVSRIPVLDIEHLRVQEPGYDAQTCVYYDGPKIEVSTDGKTPHTDKLLSGWTGACNSLNKTCVKPRDVAHLYAAFVTEILADTGLFTLHRHPLLKGNQKGLGKDKIAHCLGIIRDGLSPVDLFQTDDNRINQGMGEGIRQERNIFQFTNIDVTREYRNTLMVKWTTLEDLSGAAHGGGTWKRSPNTVTFVLTLNKGSISNDLADRLLPIMLEAEGDARERTFDFDPIDYATQHRLEIIGEWLGLAITVLKSGKKWKIPPGVDQRFKTWMEVIGAILEARGIEGFMKDMTEVESEIDELYEQFVELARRVHTDRKSDLLKAKEVAVYCGSSYGDRLFTDLLDGKKQPERELAKYILLKFVGKKVNLSVEEGAVPVIVKLERQFNSSVKVNEYRFVGEQTTGGASGSDCGSGGSDGSEQGSEKSPLPLTSSYEEHLNTGVKGGKSYEFNLVSQNNCTHNDDNRCNSSKSYLYGYTPENAPGTPCPPQTVNQPVSSVDNPWGDAI